MAQLLLLSTYGGFASDFESSNVPKKTLVCSHEIDATPLGPGTRGADNLAERAKISREILPGFLAADRSGTAARSAARLGGSLSPKRASRTLSRAVAFVLFVATGIASGAEPAAPVTDPASSLEAEVIAPFRQQLEALAAKGAAHKQAIDSGAAHELQAGPGFGAADDANRRLRAKGFDYPPGWVMKIVRPFENDYYTTQYSEHEFLGWAWSPGAEGREARIRYRESLMLKASDSLEAVHTDAWQPWLTLEHHLLAVRTADGWNVEEAAAPTPTPGALRKRNLYDVPTVPAPGS